MVQFATCRAGALIPTRATDGSAGFDLFGMTPVDISWSGRDVIPTGITVAIPPGYVGIVKPRSSHAVRYGLDVLAGVIDSDYRKELGVVLICHGREPCRIPVGKAIAQLVIVPHLSASQWVSELDDPGTRSGGYGSTGR